jgi:hypothetical protein
MTTGGDTAADTRPSFEHHDLMAGGMETATCGQAGQAGAHDHDATHDNTAASMVDILSSLF